MSTVVIIGEGLLSDFVYRELSGQYEAIRQAEFGQGVLQAAQLVLVLRDEWRPSDARAAEEALQGCGRPWLSGFVTGEEGVIGPLVRPDMPGCTQCAETRLLMAGQGSEEMVARQLRLLMHGEQPGNRHSSRQALLQMAYLTAEEARRILQGRPSPLQNGVHVFDLKTLKSSLHRFLPDPLCPVCGRLPDDSPDLARISLQPRPKLDANSYRIKPIEALKDKWIDHYLDSRIGLMQEKIFDLESAFANVLVKKSTVLGDDVTAGRSHRYATSELTAILEGLERYCSMLPRCKRTVVHDTYRNVAEQALNPTAVGVYAEAQYALPDFPFEPFDPERPIDWVWGYSLLKERPVLVPKSLAYYSVNDEYEYVNEGSNGCALGGSLEEAILYGILEVVERDAFLMAWYAQLPVPRLDPRSAKDIELRLMIDRLRAVAGYDVLLFNTTMESGIPSIWAVAKNRKRGGANLVCAAGAHPDPIRAAKSAVHELAGLIHYMSEQYESNPEESIRMYRDPSLVVRMEDHSLLYCAPEAEERLRFLLDNRRPLRTFAEEFKQRNPQHEDLTDDLKDMLQKFGRLNLDVIAVDQSAPETLRSGLHCVKVLIPGMLPITFGHHLRRLAGLERVLRIPMELGYAKRRLTLDQLNPHPHPFP